ncbi:RagB/SusD family nutrient uptake outer membrane protein [Rapidithrix thailandica]|uniref:RagB/SusD family nutrient uptake outer membrane protein n=1 Tax=Rapidithrix thailandica TaxID=413964 RepID=A0AAW9S4M7_9BACT
MKIYFPFLLVLLVSCQQGFLEKKPDQSLVVPSTLEDLQALLDHDLTLMNEVPALGLIASDELYTTQEGYRAFIHPAERNAYHWAVELYEGEPINDWDKPYQQVFYSNVVLEALTDIPVTQTNNAQWEVLQGSALFYRAHAFFQLAQLFSAPYGQDQALGIPLRLSADVKKAVRRASLEDTFSQIIQDLEKAENLLPLTSPYKTRPSRLAVWALLARVYLIMENYSQALDYARKFLQEQRELLDYTELDTSQSRPFPSDNPEVVFEAVLTSYMFTISSQVYVDSLLYQEYTDGDLRKSLFFKEGEEGYLFKGSYTGNFYLFGGLATDEVFFISAESKVRTGDIAGALKELNELLQSRWRPEDFVPITEAEPEALLSRILEERRKQLVFRGIRWQDLRRLNQDPRFALTLERTLEGEHYTLPPEDPRYVFSIPEQEIQLSGIEQNSRK